MRPMRRNWVLNLATQFLTEMVTANLVFGRRSDPLVKLKFSTERIINDKAVRPNQTIKLIKLFSKFSQHVSLRLP